MRSLGVLTEIDCHLGRALLRFESSDQPLAALAGALTSRAVQAGHVSLDLAHLASEPVVDREDNLIAVAWPSLDAWRTAFDQSSLVGASSAPDDTGNLTPLVVDSKHRVYLQRYASYQDRLVAQLSARTRKVGDLDESVLAAGLERLFPSAPASSEQPAFDAQRFAALLAVHGHFTVISGGPGTGKTTAVGKVLLLLQEQAAAAGKPPLRITLVAPTGKAAQRLTDSLGTALASLDASPGTMTNVPAVASTIHRALGYSSRTPTRFRRNQQHPLGADVVVVDEASMVDLALMTKLVEAVPSTARLILLGDKDQLASVEAGAIFGDIFQPELERRYSPALVQLAERLGSGGLASALDLPPIADSTVHLSRSYRYADDSSIGDLARALRAGDGSLTTRALSAGGDVVWVRAEPDAPEPLELKLRETAEMGYREYARESDPARRLVLLSGFRFLSAHRRGPLGIESLNRLVEQSLTRHGLEPTEGHYDGRPIMITENDYQIGLFNGDIGVLGREPGQERLFATFQSPDGPRRVQASRLPAHETVFAMTVHKSQGSEFDRIALVMPERPSRVFTRELLYTAVTRARRQVIVFGSGEVLLSGVTNPIHRSSGIGDALWRGAH
jgi:exodeoxyribonuclease V alpha subunit